MVTRAVSVLLTFGLNSADVFVGNYGDALLIARRPGARRVEEKRLTRAGASGVLRCCSHVTVGSRHGVAAASLRAVAYKPASLLDEESIQQSLCWHERRGALVLDQEHQEFRRLGAAC